MNTLSPFSEQLQKVFDLTPREVVGLVEDLLALCPDQGLQLDWHANQCRVHRLGVESQEVTEIAMPKSVFRAIVARLAALCNERVANSVSPYGGEGELSIGTNTPKVFRVSFTNTPGEQRFDIRPKTEDKEDARDSNGSIRSA